MFNGQPVSVQPESCNKPLADRGEVGAAAELLPGENVGYVHFDNRNLQTSDSICDGDGGVGVGPGVQDNRLAFFSGLLQCGDYGAFIIGLEKEYLVLGVLLPQSGQEGFKWGVSV